MSSIHLAEQSDIFLLDLGEQLPFEIDDKLKEQLAFAETLIISCAHYEGDVDSETQGYGNRDQYGEERTNSSSEWTCTSTTSASPPPQEEATKPFVIEDHVPEPEPEPEPEDDANFQVFFFPDCKKPLAPKDSQQSVIMVDGMPAINPIAISRNQCTCEPGVKGVCECHILLPCKCGAKKKGECICGKLQEICICNEKSPNPICTCFKDPRVCTCFPGLPKAVCDCEEVQKPCICVKTHYPKPVCDCKFKPKLMDYFPQGLTVAENWDPDALKAYESYIGAQEEEHGISATTSATSSHPAREPVSVNRLGSTKLSETDYKRLDHVDDEEPCTCQKPDPIKKCRCLKGEKCTCPENTCICGVQKTCVCSSSGSSDPNIIKESYDPLQLCDCSIPRVCKCEGQNDDCTCFPKKPICTCGDPDNCKCKRICDCKEPCFCDTLPEKPDECICLDKAKQIQAGLVCTCPCRKKDPVKLKRIRAGKQGYRWCHDVDPYHTFFDYAYGRHDKIDYKEKEKEKFKILGIFNEGDEDNNDVCPVHGIRLPKFEKSVRKPSLDCCSSVGGITISVETLGDSQDKFLVQVVSNASKEGAKTGSKLVAILDSNLHTLEENRSEYIQKRNTVKQRKSYMAICESGYYNKVTRICGDKKVIKRMYHNFEQAKNFLLEGANVVILRYISLNRHKGSLKTQTVLMDGTICESIHICPGVSQAVVNGKSIFVVKIERHIIEPTGFIHQTLTVLTLKGYIVSHEWADNSYVLHINPLLKVTPEKNEIEDHAPLREKWREDLQLFSDYLDYKSTRTQEGARYVAETGQLTSTVRDYLQTILLLKPSDVVHFTRHYFSSALSSMDLPRDEYFDNCTKQVRYFYFEE